MAPPETRDYQIDLFTFVGGQRSHTERFVKQFSDATSADEWGKQEAERRGLKEDEYQLEVELLEPTAAAEEQSE